MSESRLVVLEEIQSKIYTIRSAQVMPDRDLANFYGVKPIRLREQVKRNIKRFPCDFMFQLTEEESLVMVSQNAIPSKQHMGGTLPFVFTEQGVAAISTVLTSDRAIEVNIQIMRSFVAMRRFISLNANIFQRLDAVETLQVEHKAEADKKFEELFNALEDKSIKPRQGIFFDGQVFDSYKFVSDLIRSANKSIVLIDNYVDDTVLTHLSKRNKNVKITIVTKKISKKLSLDLNKFNKQYPPLEIKEFNNSHDRFIIIDKTEVYHFGASLKDLGKKWFAFSKMDIGALEILNRINFELK